MNGAVKVAVAFFVVIAYSLCSSSCEDSTNKRNGRALKTFVKSLDMQELSHMGRSNDSMKNDIIQQLNMNLPNFDDFVFLYLLNSSCSVCIADFMVFLDTVEISGIHNKVIVIVNSDDYPLFEYYMSKYRQTGHSQNFVLPVVTETIYPFGVVGKDIYVLFNDDVIASIEFVGESVVIKELNPNK